MGCCGNKRSDLARQNQGYAARPSGGAPLRTMVPTAAEPVYFQYTGNTALSVRGMFSWNIYRFSAPGAVIAVDRRDAASMAAVPFLKQVKSQE